MVEKYLRDKMHLDCYFNYPSFMSNNKKNHQIEERLKVVKKKVFNGRGLLDNWGKLDRLLGHVLKSKFYLRLELVIFFIISLTIKSNQN